MTRRKTPNPAVLSSGASRNPKPALSTLEKELLTREEWLRLAAQGSQLGLWYWNEITGALFWDRKTREMFGVHLVGDVTLETFYQALHPDDFARVREVWRYQLENRIPCEVEYRVVRPDGTIRWINARGSGHYDKAGNPQYMVGVHLDVTERKKGEQERLELSGRLIHAQEQERKRLAQEIHDDFGQRLALLMANLHSLARVSREAPATQLIGELTTELSGLASDLHTLSHRLHSSKLETLGLAPSINSLCVEFAKQHRIRIQFGHANVPSQVSSDTALYLFRIAQEGLHNVRKHSGASEVSVHLKADSDTICLTVLDNGRGIEADGNHSSKGIGIESMKERARLLGGRLEIQSRPWVEGTQIRVVVPMKSISVPA